MLKVEHLSKSHNGKQTLQDVSLEVGKGEIVGLFGPNGSGKTTCFNIIVGIISDYKGIIVFDGQDISNLPLYKRAKLGITYLPQDPAVFQGLSVQDNILGALELQNLSRPQMHEKMENILKDFRLDHMKGAKASRLSGGQRRRLEIARTLITNPKLIILDEPFVGIDPISVTEIKELLLKLKNQGISILITDHSVYTALQIIDKCYIMYEGSILIGDTKENVLANPKVKALYFGENFVW